METPEPDFEIAPFRNPGICKIKTTLLRNLELKKSGTVFYTTPFIEVATVYEGPRNLVMNHNLRFKSKKKKWPFIAKVFEGLGKEARLEEILKRLPNQDWTLHAPVWEYVTPERHSLVLKRKGEGLPIANFYDLAPSKEEVLFHGSLQELGQEMLASAPSSKTLQEVAKINQLIQLPEIAQKARNSYVFTFGINRGESSNQAS